MLILEVYNLHDLLTSNRLEEIFKKGYHLRGLHLELMRNHVENQAIRTAWKLKGPV